ncbi:hypothetical protein AB205_0050720 [Aquarana catesbeiana]|uniref:Uncharacterized protein n=1 Tax=Aquarana catesbeiana TaxID=8400 RepID=A0A2G9RNQ5_AQUCT|nr:hypothetical protein AB205_0050720 [Aquarana catesbeiana]
MYLCNHYYLFQLCRLHAPVESSPSQEFARTKLLSHPKSMPSWVFSGCQHSRIGTF